MNAFTLVAKLILDKKEFDDGIDESEKKGSSFGKALSTAMGIGTAAIAAATAAAASLSAEFIKGVGDVAAYGDHIDKMSQKMGISAKAYQEWDAVMQHSGTSMDAMSRGMTTLSKQAESNSDAFKKLGITEEELKSMSQEELFARTITELQNMESGTERTVLAQQLLGGSSKELGALLNTSAEDTQKMKDRVNELGGVLSDKAVKDAAAYQDSLQDMQTAITGFKNGLFADFLPALTQIMDGLTQLFIGDESGTQMIIDGIESIGEGIMNAMPGIVEKLESVISNLLGLIVNHLPQFLDMGFSIIGRMIDGVSKNLPSIIQTVIRVLTNMLSTLVSRLPEFLAMGLQIIGSLISGLLQSIPDILSSIGQILGDMWDAFVNYDWASLGKSIIDGIVQGIRNFGGQIGETLRGYASDAWKNVKSFFGISSPSKLMRDTVGKMIPAGIAVGIEANADSVLDAMDDLSKMTVDAYDPEFDDGYYTEDMKHTTSSFAPVFNIYPAQGQSEEEIAKAVERKLVQWTKQKKAVYV